MYFYTDTDLKAQQLVGKGAYQITFRKDSFRQSRSSGH